MNAKKNEDLLDEEEELIKTLSHKVRREIIKLIGMKGKLLFSEIQQRLGSIDSSPLSYHLKSLNPLIQQKDGKYQLTEKGFAALNLLSKIDQTVRLSKYKKRFTYAHIATIICWIVASSIIPIVLNLSTSFIIELVFVQLIIASISTVNGFIIGILRNRY
ncbi:MAG: helix-turn-helix transcriptional regulator [Candidatus Lokiarchaeota archaeon]|nr:helix-turn-helix transcriptional regulator [Candidatus Lokiarchaeota archaeon]